MARRRRGALVTKLDLNRLRQLHPQLRGARGSVSRPFTRLDEEPPHGNLLALVVVVGLASGLAGAAFVGTLRGLTEVLGPSNWNRWAELGVLAATGLVIAVLTRLLGNPGDVELLVDNIHVSGGRDDIRDLRALVPVSIVGIAVGSAIGPEAPLVQTTGSLGSWIARRYDLDRSDLRVLTITGMAAGFTVLFGAPLGSAIFALEILHRRGLGYAEALVPAILGALSGYAVYVSITGLGLEPVWSFPRAHPLEVLDLGIGVLAGIGGAVVAAAFTYAARGFRAGFRRMPAFARPVIGGLALGGLAFASPYALTYGENQITHVLDTRLLIGTLVVAGLVKLAASSMIVSAGWRGGFIIPLFFIGVVFGSAVSQALGTDRTVTMAALMVACNVGVTKTVVGSTLVVAEMGGMPLLPPALVAAVVALFLTSRVSMIETQRDREGETDEPVDRGPASEAPDLE
jgi:chloride channel protein, CIC family